MGAWQAARPRPRDAAARPARLLLALALLGSGARADDLVPAAIDALLATPSSTPFTGLIQLLQGHKLYSLQAEQAPARAVAALGDVNGDGVEDWVLGLAPGAAADTVQARDGATGALLWSARPDGGGVRSLRGLAVRDGRLAIAASSAHGRLECRALDGSLLWSVDLLPGGGAQAANLLSADWLADLDGDGVDEVLVAGGKAVPCVALFSGADGSLLWSAALHEGVADARPTADLDGDGFPDVLALGGVRAPFAVALSGRTGELLWQVPLPAPGSVLAALDDVNGDGLPDVAVGLFAEPASCLAALSGADGALLWQAAFVTRNVTSLALPGDIDGDGHVDLVVGSFDHGVTAVSGAQGINLWRLEVAPNDTGAMLAVAAVGDLDGNGFVDILSGGMDQRAVLIDGRAGFPHWIQDLRFRVTAVTALTDQTGDGRPELLVVGSDGQRLIDGASGTVVGPVVTVVGEGGVDESLSVQVFAYASSQLWVLASLGPPGSLALPGFQGSFQLSPATLVILHAGGASGAGGSAQALPLMPREMVGVEVFFQAAVIPPTGPASFSELVSHVYTR